VPRHRIDHQVLNPHVQLAVPDHVDKTKQLISISRGNLPEAVIPKQVLPVGLTGNDNSSFKCVAVKSGDLKILKRPSPLASIRHEFMILGRLKRWSLGPDATVLPPLTGACASRVGSLRRTDPNNLSKANYQPARSLIDVATMANGYNHDQQISVINRVNDSVVANPETVTLTPLERS